MIARMSLLSGSALALALAATPAFGQSAGETGPPAAEAAPTVELASADVQAPAATPEAQSADEGNVVVTARRRSENVQLVPVAISVVGGEQLDQQGLYNVNRVTQTLPTLQFFSTNPRNTFINIRGIGAPFGLTNDGFEQGVGIYVDQVYYNRIAAAMRL